MKSHRYQVKRDSNHTEIQAVFERMLAGHVTDISRADLGMGDLFVSFGDYQKLIEIKMPDGDFTAAEIAFHKRHPKAVWTCYTTDQAITFCNAIRRLAARLGAIGYEDGPERGQNAATGRGGA